MKPILFILYIVLQIACAKTTEQGLPSQGDTNKCVDQKVLKSLWHSKTDNETHDWRNRDFTFLFEAYQYVSSSGQTCNQDFRWFMFTPDVNGASFRIEFQNIDPNCPSPSMYYIKIDCKRMWLCDSNFSCKEFE